MASKFNTWVSAARLRTIPLSISGVLIGSFASLNENKFNLFVFLLTLLTTVSYQVLSNFANDYGDGAKGTDKNRIGPTRSIESGAISLAEMKKGIILAAIFSLFLTILLVYISFQDDLINFVIFIAENIARAPKAIKFTKFIKSS
jgi:1,4-dihydroxy-2-naphthoate octaprenyltransferase